MKPLFLLFLLGLLVCHRGQAQRAKLPNAPPEQYGTTSKKARTAYEESLVAQGYHGYAEALDWLNKALAEDPNFVLAYYRRGESYYNLRRPQEALPDLERARKMRPSGLGMPHLFFYLGRSYMLGGNYAQAVEAYQHYLAQPKVYAAYAQQAAEELRRADFARLAQQHPLHFELKNLGPAINGPGDEYLPCLTADERLLYFTSRRESNLGAEDPLRLKGDYDEDLYFSQAGAQGWQPAVNLGPPVNTTGSEGAANFSQDGQAVYFTACDRDSNGPASCDIFRSELEKGKWLPPQRLGPAINTPGFDSQPCVSNDGKRLFFVSSRPGGLGGTDLYVSFWLDGSWSPAQNLGAPINTPGNEYSPFIHADDQSFYFSSDYLDGFGGYDLFLSRYTANGWAEPQNLGYPLNTPGNEKNIFITADGRHGYINSDAPGGYGHSDLYEFEVDSSFRPRPATYVRGTVTDSLSGIPVGGTITFINLPKGDTIRSVQAVPGSGHFLLSLPLEHDYAAYVDAAHYLFYSQHFSLKNLQHGQQYFDLAIRLQPIRSGATVVLNNIFFPFNSAELLPTSQVELVKLVRFLKANPTTRVEIRGHTDDQGTPTYNLKLSKDRAEAVRAYLLAKGIPAGQLLAKGYGESRPVAANEDEVGRAQNRRTEFKIL